MKVLLIRPRADRESIGLQSFMICEPLELEYAAAHLEQHATRSRFWTCFSSEAR